MKCVPQARCSGRADRIILHLLYRVTGRVQYVAIFTGHSLLTQTVLFLYITDIWLSYA